MSRLSRIVTIAMLSLVLTGGHLALLQITALTSMLIVRSGEQGLIQAMQSTFSGARPCALCRVVHVLAAAQQNDGSALPAPLAGGKAITKVEALVDPPWSPGDCSCCVAASTTIAAAIHQWCLQPELPPPKAG
jgi:hypothetical protein